MVSSVKIVPCMWSAPTEEHKQRIREFYNDTNNAFDEHIKLLNVEWIAQTPMREKDSLKTTKQDKDDDYVRQTKQRFRQR